MRSKLLPLIFAGVIFSFFSFNANAQVSEIVFDFLSRYSNSLLYGNYQSHAALFSDPTYFEGRYYTKQQITNVAKNFYSKNITLSHSWKVLDYHVNSKGMILIEAIEYQTIRPRNGGRANSTAQKKLIFLGYENGYKCFSKTTE
ncbi:MAG: hypothetical protein LC102_11640 [Ignavibacteriales bacterium]|nr:MAG: hypothetical protein F9K26_02230 [Ignavibacteriaceae bacterium]MBW7872253.1 hypothetical protein [Ignavibacteria bacterium]MCZ2144065.1 hypothetical protein [Ignavibacteriales bacterium]OQY79243.1 MAG: hypothetical protein B6D45_01220 [Ignavibacteriales bacterium UTCHB3]MBV6445600.1 hypothetical protein [Ignavibacteriaceae bacterium]